MPPESLRRAAILHGPTTGLPFAVVPISQRHASDGKERHSATVYLTGAGWRGYALALEALFWPWREG